MARVRVPPVLRTEAGGNREVEAEGGTVGELLDDLRTRLPQLGEKIYDGVRIAPFVNVYLDGEDVRTLDGVAESRWDSHARHLAACVLPPWQNST